MFSVSGAACSLTPVRDSLFAEITASQATQSNLGCIQVEKKSLGKPDLCLHPRAHFRLDVKTSPIYSRREPCMISCLVGVEIVGKKKILYILQEASWWAFVQLKNTHRLPLVSRETLR